MQGHSIVRPRPALWASLTLSLLLACSSSDEGKSSGAPDAGPGGGNSATATLGAEGGTLVAGPSTSLEVPAGALAESITLTIAKAGDGAPAPPQGKLRLGATWQIGPAGTAFAEPVTVTIPWSPELLAPGADPSGVRLAVASQASGPWTPLETTVGARSASAQVEHLSWFVALLWGCVGEGSGCDHLEGIICCPPAVCEGDTCVPCLQENQPCRPEQGCCEGLRCSEEEGRCVPCVPRGSACGAPYDCCDFPNTACFDQACGDCVEEGYSCAGTNCCPGMFCVSATCSAQCGQLGEGCNRESDCCGWVSDGTDCVGGVCTRCAEVGADCAQTPCCEGSFCDAATKRCTDCYAAGRECSSPGQCCSKLCERDRCTDCRTEAGPCASPEQCCTGTCDNHTCAACPAPASACGAPADCCPGRCCEHSPLTCDGERCTACLAANYVCGPDGPSCCGDLLCIEGVCQACRAEGGECAEAEQCCGDLGCKEQRCTACEQQGAFCGPDQPCCELDCIMGICQACLDLDAVCNRHEDCCSETCVQARCIQCGVHPEPCDEERPCCSDHACEDGTCQQTCARPTQSCQDLRCCPGGFCVQSACMACAQNGEGCADKPCCPPLECGVGSGTCRERPNCSCNDPGVVISEVSGCDSWEETTTCDAWVRAVLLQNGWQETPERVAEAMALEVRSGSGMCGEGCCIEIHCP